MFSEEKWGYSKEEVDSFVTKQKSDYEATILALKTENEELKQQINYLKAQNIEHSKKAEKISDALVYAVEKKEEIEEENKNYYAAELKKIRELYLKWVGICDEIQKKYGIVDEKEISAKRFSDDVENFLKNVINIDLKKQEPKPSEEKFYHKQLLNRMSGLISSITPQKEPEQEFEKEIDVVVKLPKKIEERLSQKAEELARKPAKKEHKEHVSPANVGGDIYSTTKSQIKPILGVNGSKGSYSSLLDKYLNDDEYDELSNSYAKKLAKAIDDGALAPNESGFDLREAVNPKESLEEILKDFDFDD